ncbi:MAG: S-layer homology domain-containing protein [Firmicutes bacterium]|nr:S-layer homology domain-containing protein [Bacillota bacterium]
MRRHIATALLLLSLFFAFSGRIWAAPLFPDVPESHWAKDAVANLAARGIIEGYPDGTFKGDRGNTRWEMAMMIQRALARMEAEHSKFATKSDLEALRALANQYKDELDAIGVRVKSLEDNVTALDTRTAELERIRFYGYFQTIVVGNDLQGSLRDVGTRNVPVVDWTNGRILQKGMGFTALAKLGTVVKANKDTSFGIDVIGFNSTGDTWIDMYWGVSAPYLCNPFTSQGSANGGLQPLNNSPWTRVVLDRFWYRYSPLDLTLIVGSFHPEKVESSVLLGARNPNINSPSVLPLYGVDVKGKMGTNSSGSYEVLYSRLPQAAFYQTQTLAGSVSWKFKNGEVKVHYLNANNSDFGDGKNQGAGGVILPNYPLSPGNPVMYWKTRYGSTSSPNLGPQDMNILGLNVDYNFNKNWMGYVKFASSSYDPDTTNQIYTDTACGSLVNLGVKASYDRVRGQLEYLSVSNNYDPFVLQYPAQGAGIMVFLPYSTYYYNYYQLHDYLRYPSNRQGARFNAEYDFSKQTTAGINYSYLEQYKASTYDNFTKVGNIEPLFPCLQGGGSQKGKIQETGIWLRHDFGKLKGKIGYSNFAQRRSAPAVDDIDLKEDLVWLNLSYNMSRNFDILFNYNNINYSGHNGTANTGFRQQIPSLSGVYKINKDTSAGLTYRYYNFENTVVKNSDWHGSQIMMEYKLNF